MKPYLDARIVERNKVANAHDAMAASVPERPPPDGDWDGSSSDEDLGWGRTTDRLTVCS